MACRRQASLTSCVKPFQARLMFRMPSCLSVFSFIWLSAFTCLLLARARKKRASTRVLSVVGCTAQAGCNEPGAECQSSGDTTQLLCTVAAMGYYLSGTAAVGIISFCVMPVLPHVVFLFLMRHVSCPRLRYQQCFCLSSYSQYCVDPSSSSLRSLYFFAFMTCLSRLQPLTSASVNSSWMV